MSPVLYKVTSKYFSSNPVKAILDGASQVAWTVVHKILTGKRVSVATVDLGAGKFSADPFLRGSVTKKTLEKGKGCDIGYALAVSSCEGAHCVEARTVTALDAITAFAVPNPNYSSQSRRFFQVWPLIWLPF
jgi:hypothetical protein